MKQDQIPQNLIPLDKSWAIRIIFLDILNGYKDSLEKLESTKIIGDDLIALKKISKDWNLNKPLEVGESGTIFRFLKFANWKLDLKKEFVISGTLKNRDICNDKKIIDWSQEELLKLDNNTSQWASAAVLLGDKKRLPNPPFKLKLTYDAVDYYYSCKKQHEAPKLRYDDTILNQAKAYVHFLKTGKMEFKPIQAEDYCFARAFNLITKEEGKTRWPSLVGHESNRIKEMEEQLKKEEITSKDHRVIQAIVMKNKGNVKVRYKGCVNKSWPEFWDFMRFAKTINL